jgi:hypothetical protein
VIRTDTKVFRPALEERVSRLLSGTLLCAGRGRSGFLASSFLGGLVIETNRQ